MTLNFTLTVAESLQLAGIGQQTQQTLAAILAGVQQLLTGQAQEAKTMSAIDDQITALTADVAEETTVNQSAVTLINGFAAQLAAAIAAAQAAGATPAELASLTALGTSISANTTALTAALTANTPASPSTGP